MVADIAYMQEQQQSISRMHDLFDAQRAAFRKAPMPSADERIQQLQALKQGILKHQQALIDAIADPAVQHIDVTRRASRRSRYFNVPTQIYFSEATERDCTIVEIITADRPGLLSEIGDVFRESGILLETAKIATIGERAEDIFFVTDHDHQPLRNRARLLQLRQTLTAELDKTGP